MTLVHQTTTAHSSYSCCKSRAVNDDPTLDALSDVNINEDDPEQTVNLTGITAGGGETQVLSITATVTTQV